MKHCLKRADNQEWVPLHSPKFHLLTVLASAARRRRQWTAQATGGASGTSRQGRGREDFLGEGEACTWMTSCPAAQSVFEDAPTRSLIQTVYSIVCKFLHVLNNFNSADCVQWLICSRCDTWLLLLSLVLVFYLIKLRRKFYHGAEDDRPGRAPGRATQR